MRRSKPLLHRLISSFDDQGATLAMGCVRIWHTPPWKRRRLEREGLRVSWSGEPSESRKPWFAVYRRYGNSEVIH